MRNEISTSSENKKATIGVYGLGVMGSALARNFAAHGETVAVYTIEEGHADQFVARYGNEGNFIATHSEKEFANTLQIPRIAAVMVTAGTATASVTHALADVFQEGDVIIDMGNSFYRDTQEREKELRSTGIAFVGCGTSGGEEGALHGPSLMVGGSEKAYRTIYPLFEKIAAHTDDGHACLTHVGTDGAGHFVKMIHNGIEYVDMQLLAETYALLRHRVHLSPACIADVFATWNHGPLASYLLEISSDILRHIDPDTKEPFIDIVADRAHQKGTGQWAAQAALDLGVAAPSIAYAPLVRYLSDHTSQRVRAHESITDPRVCEGLIGDTDTYIQALHDGLYGAKIMAYSQGIDIMHAAARRYGWDIHWADIARIWRAGCIIRARFLDDIAHVYDAHPERELLISDAGFAQILMDVLPSWRQIVADAYLQGIGVPELSTCLSSLDQLRASTLSTNLIQAQRDYFGAHTYERTDREGTFHTTWANPNQSRREYRIH